MEDGLPLVELGKMRSIVAQRSLGPIPPPPRPLHGSQPETSKPDQGKETKAVCCKSPGQGPTDRQEGQRSLKGGGVEGRSQRREREG